MSSAGASAMAQPRRAGECGQVNIGSVGISCPPCRLDQTTADSLLTHHYGAALTPRALDIMHRLLSHPGIRTRHFAVENLDELPTLKSEDPDLRIARFTRWSVDLSRAAAAQALERVHLDIKEVDALVVNTCTGYLCPGISTYLAEALGMPPGVKTFDLVGHGCGGALPNLQLAHSLVASGAARVVLSVAVEVCTATFQMGNDLSLVVSNAIFADGAAAAVVWHRPQGPAIVDTRSFLAPKYRDHVRYVYRQGQLHNRLSPDLPELTATMVAPVVKELLSPHGLSPDMVPHWAIHPGGDKILSNLQQRLSLSDRQVSVSREVLRDFGNMSSPTVLFELEKLLSQGNVGEWGVAVGFGAGFSAYATLLQW